VLLGGLQEIGTRLFAMPSSFEMNGDVLLGVLPEVGPSVLRLPSSLQTIDLCDVREL
jgi:hypothetical protein